MLSMAAYAMHKTQDLEFIVASMNLITFLYVVCGTTITGKYPLDVHPRPRCHE